MTWKDLFITPMVEVVIVGAAFFSVMQVNKIHRFSFFMNVVLFYGIQVFYTLMVLKLIRMLFPIKGGVYSQKAKPFSYYIFSLYEFLCITNLNRYYMNIMIPPVFRKIFYQFLGAKMGRGIIPIGGRLLNPVHLISIEENVMIGDGAELAPHSRIMGDIVILGNIEIKKGAIIGGRSLLMPWVTVGENSMVNSMSFVSVNTKIPPNEVWGGIPAKKIADMPAS